MNEAQNNMNWKKLKDGRCPKCTAILLQEGDKLICTICGFSIGESKMYKIISGRNNDRGEVEDNFSALQNLGHEEVTEDFSDSPFLDI